MVDDHLLALHLGDRRFSTPGSGPVATTCSWWWRLSSAVTGGRRGALSRLFTEEELAADAPTIRAIASVRDDLAILDLRELIPTMARVAATFRLNLLASEALVAAEVLGADIVVGQDTPRLRQAARVRGITYRVET